MFILLFLTQKPGRKSQIGEQIQKILKIHQSFCNRPFFGRFGISFPIIFIFSSSPESLLSYFVALSQTDQAFLSKLAEITKFGTLSHLRDPRQWPNFCNVLFSRLGPGFPHACLVNYIISESKMCSVFSTNNLKSEFLGCAIHKVSATRKWEM